MVLQGLKILNFFMEGNILVEATTGAEVSDAVETATIGMLSDLISDNVLNSSNPQPESKTPSSRQSPQYSSKYTPSPNHDKTLFISHVMPPPKPNSKFDVDESDSHTIS